MKAVTDDMVEVACDIYERVYVDDDKSIEQSMRAALEAVIVPAQCVNPSAERYEQMRRTLESRSVRLMGPRSPFWQCEYCQALAQSPIAFKHKPECLMATEVK